MCQTRNVVKKKKPKKPVLHWTMRRWSQIPTFLVYYQTLYYLKAYCQYRYIMLSENDSIISEPRNQFPKYSTSIFQWNCWGYWFNDPIPDNFDKDDILLSLRYDDHPSIMAIKKFCTQGQSFDFVHVISNDVKSCIVNLDSKKSTGYDRIPVKLLQVCTDPLCMIMSELINMPID